MEFSKIPLGVIPSPPDFRDYRLYEFTKIEEDKDLPEEYLVPPYEREEDIPVYNQGHTSMCVAFTGASIKEQQEYLEKGKAARMSSGWIYGNREQGMYFGEGMIPREAWRMLCKYGTTYWDDFPVAGDFNTCYTEVLKRKQELLKKAADNKTLSYVAINKNNENEIKTAIMKCGFINVSIAVYSDFVEVGEDGYLTSSVRGRLRGYHSLTAVGWKKHKGRDYLIILNSWSTSWGRNGFCYMPFNYKGFQEIWALTDMERRVVEAGVTAQIVPPGHFVVPFRGLFEAENAEAINWWRNNKGRIEAEAVLPPAKRRRVHIEEGSKDIIVEILE